MTEEEVILFIEAENGELCALAQYDRHGRIYNGECTQNTFPRLVSISVSKQSDEKKVAHKIEEAEKRLINLKELQRVIIENKKS